MYIPKYHAETDLEVLHSLITEHPLGTWVVYQDGKVTAHHIPFMLIRSRGEYGTLVTHVSKGNSVWKAVHANADSSMIIFQGANTYITPSWYASKQEHGKVVPTWNYAAVHVYGVPSVITDMQWLRAHLHSVTDLHEAQQPTPWKVDDAPAEFIERTMQGIVGIEIPIERITGKWKVSQNRNSADRQGIVAGLTALGSSDALEMITMIEQQGNKYDLG